MNTRPVGATFPGQINRTFAPAKRLSKLTGKVSHVESTNLFAVCGIAFGAVFVLLTFLALVMQLLTVLFPERKSALDPTVVAAISSTVASLYPGARVSRIEEES